jgi:lysophospholipase L1-like esterase
MPGTYRSDELGAEMKNAFHKFVGVLLLMIALSVPALAQSQQIFTGVGSPEGAQAGNPGDVFLSWNGTEYLKNSGNGKTGWISIALESLGMKLRRLAAAAQVSNPLMTAPLAPAPAWVANTAYIPGNVVTNGGNLYQCNVGGTAAVSGGPTGTGAALITDNTAKWYFMGVPVTTSASPVAPTISTLNSNPGGLTSSYTYASRPDVFQIAGGHPVFTSSGHYCIGTTSSPNVGNCGNSLLLSATHYGISFWTDAPTFTIVTDHGAANPYRILINNQYVNLSSVSIGNSADPEFQQIDFSTAGLRFPRLVTFEASNSTTFTGVNIGPLDSIWAPSSKDYVRAIFVGDSIVGSTNAQIPDSDVGRQLGKLMGWDVWPSATGGTGLTVDNGGNGYAYVNRITDVTSYSPNIVLFNASTNDGGASSSTITSAAVAYMTTLRSALPSVPIIVTGIIAAGNPSSNTTNETAVQAAVTSLNDPRIFFVPVTTLTTPWFTGTGNIGSPSGSGSNDVYSATNAPHLTPGGYTYLAQQLATAIRNNVLPFIP